MTELLEVIGDGHYATPVTEEEQKRDDVGFTHPNLHRRVNPADREVSPYTEEFLMDDNDNAIIIEDDTGIAVEIDPSYEYRARDYLLDIYGFNSYRTMIQYVHNEDEAYTNNEIP